MCDFASLPPELHQKAQELEARLCLSEHSRLVRFILAHYRSLDFDQADCVASAARERFVTDSISHALAGDPDRLDHPEKYRRVLYGRYVWHSVVDEIRRLKAGSWRNESIDAGAVEDSIGRGELRSNDDPYRDLLVNWCKARLPHFFAVLDRGRLAPTFRRLRQLAHEIGCRSLTEEYTFLNHYLFERSSEDGDPARAELTRRLDLFPGRPDNARDVAMCKLRKRLMTRWREVENLIFHRPRAPDHKRRRDLSVEKWTYTSSVLRLFSGQEVSFPLMQPS